MPIKKNPSPALPSKRVIRGPSQSLCSPPPPVVPQHTLDHLGAIMADIRSDPAAVSTFNTELVSLAQQFGRQPVSQPSPSTSSTVSEAHGTSDVSSGHQFAQHGGIRIVRVLMYGLLMSLQISRVSPLSS